MSICWWCHWGWPEQVASIRRQAERELADLEERSDKYDPLEFGPSHVVWSDENFDDRCVRACLKDCDKGAAYYGMNDKELDIVRRSLERLLAVPKEYRTVPKEYDGENPERYPPPEGWVMDRKQGVI